MLKYLIWAIFSVLPLGAVADGHFPVATGAPVLTIEHADQIVTLDAEGVRTLPARSFTTETIWTEGPQTFTGVSVTELLNQLGVTEGELNLIAANGYQITIPVDHFTSDGALIAYDRNGSAMTLRDKGPLWIVYPYDSDPAFRTEIIYANSIWQLERIAVVN